MTRRSFALAASLCAVSAITVFGQDSKFTRPSLEGLTSVGVVVEDGGHLAERHGLSKAVLQTDAELKLRLAGIPVLSDEDVSRTPGSPYLHISLTILINGPAFAVKTDVELIQDVLLPRKPSIMIEGISYLQAPTWNVSSLLLGNLREVPRVRDSIKDDLDEFINAWLAVNPPRAVPRR